MSIESKLRSLGTDTAPGQEVRQSAGSIEAVLRGDRLTGTPVDFSHGDVDAFRPTPGAFEEFSAGVARGGRQAYTEYRGDISIRETIATRLADFTGAPVDARDGLIITPGTQGALFLAVAATVSHGDRVAIVQPDYFANRKLVAFLDAEVVPVALDYRGRAGMAGLATMVTLSLAAYAAICVLIMLSPSTWRAE